MSNNASNRTFNPWPYAIMGFFGVAIAAAVVWVVFCIGNGTDLVAADYYEQEVEYQKQIERVNRTLSLAGGTGIQYFPGEAMIQVRIPEDHAGDQLQGIIRLYRPSEAGLDQDLRLQVSSKGMQRVDVASLKPGLWDVRVQWLHGGKEYFLSEKITVGGGGS
jgi:nitrogen fixation protein FixH